MSESLSRNENKKEVLKEMIKRLHEGANLEEIKEKFKEILEGVTPVEIAKIEEELIKEGMPREEIQRLCEVHLAVLKEPLEKEKTLAPEGHPIHILMEEHKILLKFTDELKNIVTKIKDEKDFNSVTTEMEQIKNIEKHLKDSERHYLREENVLFPYLEKHGVTEPPAIMWMEHDKIREIKKNLYSIIDGHEDMVFQDFIKQFENIAISLSDMLTNHFFKENNILYPTAMKVITESEWNEVIKQFNEIGYCCFTPVHAKVTAEKIETPIDEPEIKEGKVPFETGTLSKEEIESIFNTLPVDITFVDKDDTVRYFSEKKDKIFVRSKAIIGGKVQQCHPQKSIHIVNQILKDFKIGRKDSADFWINFEGKLIYIRYFAVRNKSGEYLGCIEVTQDITDIKKIEEEKRLL